MGRFAPGEHPEGPPGSVRLGALAEDEACGPPGSLRNPSAEELDLGGAQGLPVFRHLGPATAGALRDRPQENALLRMAGCKQVVRQEILRRREGELPFAAARLVAGQAAALEDWSHVAAKIDGLLGRQDKGDDGDHGLTRRHRSTWT